MDEITDEAIYKVLLQYLGCECYSTITKVTAKWTRIEFEYLKRMKGKSILLCLKQLSDITDEDAEAINALMFTEERESDIDDKELAKYMREEENDWVDVLTPMAYQYLQSQYYDLPNFYLGGKTLIDLGYAVDIKTL